MVQLAVECTQAPINIAVGWDDKVYGYAVGPNQRNAADNLFEVVAAALAQAGKNKDDITEIVAVTGPGSFTGIRVGLSFAQSFGLARQIPIHGLTTFDILAAVNPNEKKRLIIVESKREELYAQFYQANLPLNAPLMATSAELRVLAVLENAEVIAPQSHGAEFSKLPVYDCYDAGKLAMLALSAYWQLKPMAQSNLEPFYIRPPDAIPQIKSE